MLCRKLLSAGFDAKCPLHCYRGDVLCLTVSSIGWGAEYTIAEGTSGRPFMRGYTAPKRWGLMGENP
jgi:hypothetical protein